MNRDYLEAEGFCGFPPELVGGPDPTTTVRPARVRSERSGTVDQIRQWRIDDGECPRVCPGQLEDGCCPVCGWSLLEERMRERLEAREVAVLPEQQIPLEEFGPAEVDAA